MLNPGLPGASWLGMVLGPPRLYPPVPWVLLGLLQAMEWVFLVYTVYSVAIPVAGGLWKGRRPPHAAPRSRFAIVVPAHNEALVVGNLIQSCLATHYPQNLFDIYVIADNCEDRTADVAAAAGALVIERENREQTGKGYALDYAFRWIQARDGGYDAFVVFDADNLVHPDFLSIMNDNVCAGHQVIQGRMDAKNPMDTWVSGTFGMSVWVSNRFWFLAKYNLGFSSVLGGTGMCIRCDLIQRIGWGTTSFTEDLEFTMKALLQGVGTVWAHDAICYDEKVQTFAASWKQRKRWVQGQSDVARLYLGRMLWRGLTELSPVYLEAAFQLFNPFYLLLGTFLMVCGYVIPSQYLVDPMLRHLETPVFWAALMAIEYTMPVAATLIDRGPWRTLKYLILYPVFINSWLPLAWVGILGPRQKHWAHTEHTRAMAYSELAALRAERR